MENFIINHRDGITSKDISAFLSLFRSELQKSDTANFLELTSKYFIGDFSTQGSLTVLTRVREILLKSEHYNAFKNLCDNELDNSFFFKDLISKEPNPDSAYNYSLLFGKEELFSDREFDFIQKLYIILISLQSQKVSSTKLLELFLDYQKVPQELDCSNQIIQKLSFVSTQLDLKLTTFSCLAAICIEALKIQTNFDKICCIVRCLSICVFETFISADSDEKNAEKILLDIFSGNESSKLSIFLSSHLSKHDLLLLFSCYIQKYPIFCQKLIEKIDSDLLAAISTPIERCFGYTALLRCVSALEDEKSIVEFTSKLMEKYLMRDIDARNPILPSSLINLYKNLTKRCKSLKMTPILHKSIYASIEDLSWHSKVKLMVIPDIIESYPDQLFNELIEMAQDPSDFGFVTKCVKTVAKSVKTAESLLNSIIKDSENNNFIEKKLRNYKNLLEPIYLHQPSLIKKAFDMFSKLEKRFVSIWIRFESLLLITRSKWPIFDLVSDLNYAVHSVNWDLRCASFQIFAKCDFQNKNSFDVPIMFCMNLSTLMYCDSAKHTFMIEEAFVDFVENVFVLNNRKDKSVTEKVIFPLLDIISDHMLPSFVSSHRQFALRMMEIAWNRFPNVFNQKHLDAVSSILTDGSLSLRYVVKEKIKSVWKDKNFHLVDENSENETNAKHNCDDKIQELMTKMMKDNDFESIKMISTLIDDKNSTFSESVIEKICDEYFDFFINTKNVGISLRSQTTFVSLCRLMEQNMLIKKQEKWEKTLLAILRDFDMESMRRSASLPDVALALVRLAQLTQSNKAKTSSNSAFSTKQNDSSNENNSLNENNDNNSSSEIILAIIDLVKKTDCETEAVNSLNVVRAIMKDKSTSKDDDILFPIVFEAIFASSLKFCGWDFVAASNICFASLFHKLFKRSDSSLSIIQFFQKIPNAKKLVIDSLRSNLIHSNYLALTVLTVFQKTSGFDKSLLNEVAPFLSNKASRIRRTAAIALVSITPKEEYNLLVEQCLHFISQSRFIKNGFICENNEYFQLTENSFITKDKINSNTFHGLLIVIRMILQKVEFPSFTFPDLLIEKVPPLTLDDIVIIYSKIDKKVTWMNVSQKSPFYFDDVSYFIGSKEVDPELTDMQLTALLSKVTEEPIEGLEEVIVSRLKQVVEQKNEMNTCSPLILKLSLQYLKKFHFNVSKYSYELVSLISNQIDSETCSLIIDLLPLAFLNEFVANSSISDSSSIPNGSRNIYDLKKISDLFLKIAFSKNDTDTPLKISVSRKLSEILSFFGKEDAFVVAAMLLIDDVPLVRTNAAIAVSLFFDEKGYIYNEIELFSRILKEKLNYQQKRLIFIKWISLLKSRIGNDQHGEPLTVLVDEFYVLKETLKSMNIVFDFNQYLGQPVAKNISESREGIVCCLEKVLAE